MKNYFIQLAKAFLVSNGYKIVRSYDKHPSFKSHRSKELLIEIGKRIKLYREIKKYSQTKLAKEINIRVYALILWEKGLGGITLLHLRKLSSVLGIPIIKLVCIGGINDNNKRNINSVFTQSELSTAKLIMLGYGDTEIAFLLKEKTRTIRHYSNKIRNKLGLLHYTQLELISKLNTDFIF